MIMNTRNKRTSTLSAIILAIVASTAVHMPHSATAAQAVSAAPSIAYAAVRLPFLAITAPLRWAKTLVVNTYKTTLLGTNRIFGHANDNSFAGPAKFFGLWYAATYIPRLASSVASAIEQRQAIYPRLNNVIQTIAPCAQATWNAIQLASIATIWHSSGVPWSKIVTGFTYPTIITLTIALILKPVTPQIVASLDRLTEVFG